MSLLSASRVLGRFSPETRGIGGIVLAMLLFTIMDSVAKYLMERNPPMMVTWARFVSQQMLVMVVFAPHIRRALQTRHPFLQTGRALLHVIANTVFFLALSMMAMAEAVAVFQVAPLLITVCAAILLREQVGPRRWVGVVLGLIGAMIIIRPGAEVFQPAALLPLIAALCMALFQVIARVIGSDDSIETSMLHMSFAGALIMSAVVPFFWQTPSLSDAIIMGLFGWVGFLGHICLIYALSQAPASALAPYNYAAFIWALLMGLTLFGEMPDALTLVGAGIILAAGIYVWHRERVRAREAGGDTATMRAGQEAP